MSALDPLSETDYSTRAMGAVRLPVGPSCGWILGMVALASIISCGGREATEPTLRVWAMGKEAEYLQNTIHGRRLGSHRIEVQRIPWSAAHEKLLTAYVAGTLPDVIQLGSTWIPEFSAVGALRCRSEADEKLVGDLFPGAVEANRSGNAWCATPWYVDTRVLFYRRDLLARAGWDRPPQTWQEWRQAMESIRKLGPNHYGLLAPLDEWHLLVALAFQAGAPLLRENDTRGDFRNANFRRAFSFYLSLFHDGLAPFRGEAQVANVYQDFAAGWFTFYVTGPWNLGEFSRRLPAELAEQWTTAVLPVPEPDVPSVSVMGGASLAITSSSTEPAAAQQLVDSLVSTEEQVRLHRATGDLPARRSAWQLLDSEHAGRLQAFQRQLEHARSTPRVPEWERIAGLLVRYTELAVRGHLGIDDALTKLDEETDRVLEKRRWLLQRSAPTP